MYLMKQYGDAFRTEKEPGHTSVLALGAVVPPLIMPTLDGQPYDTHEQFKGRLKVIAIWDAECGECRAEMPQLASLYTVWKAKGLNVLGISINKDREKIGEFITKSQIQFTNLCDFRGMEGPVPTALGMTGTPTLYVLDQNNRLVLRPQNIRELEMYIRTAL